MSGLDSTATDQPTKLRKFPNLVVRIPKSFETEPMPGRTPERLSIEAGLYSATINRHGAVCIVREGQLIGVKPGEFEFNQQAVAAGLYLAAQIAAERLTDDECEALVNKLTEAHCVQAGDPDVTKFPSDTVGKIIGRRIRLLLVETLNKTLERYV